MSVFLLDGAGVLQASGEEKMTAAAAALLIFTALPFPPPKVAPVTDQTKCDWGTISSVDPQGGKLIVATAAGPVTFLVPASVVVLGADGQWLPSVSALKPGQRVRIYYLVDHGARPTEIDVLE